MTVQIRVSVGKMIFHGAAILNVMPLAQSKALPCQGI